MNGIAQVDAGHNKRARHGLKVDEMPAGPPGDEVLGGRVELQDVGVAANGHVGVVVACKAVGQARVGRIVVDEHGVVVKHALRLWIWIQELASGNRPDDDA